MAIITVAINPCAVRSARIEDGIIKEKSVFKGKGAYSYMQLEKIVFADISKLKDASVYRIVVAFSGNVDVVDSRVYRCPPYMQGFIDQNIADRISEKFDIKCDMISDAHASLLGEIKYGAGRGYNSAALLSIEENVGSAYFLFDNNVFGDSYDYADIAHRKNLKNDALCECGLKGCFEQYISGRALDSAAVAAGLTITNRAEIFELYALGDAKIKNIVDTYAQNLINALKALKTVAPADIYIIGGSLSICIQQLMPKIIKALPKMRIALSVFGVDAALYGAYEWGMKFMM